MCAGAAVYSPLKREGVKAGDRVGVVGIGGLGHLALQLQCISELNATPVAFSSSSRKEQEARPFGAAEFYNLNDPEDVNKAAGSVDVLLVTVAAPELPYNAYLRLVRKLSTLVMLGVPPDDVRFMSLRTASKSLETSSAASRMSLTRSNLQRRRMYARLSSTCRWIK
ncbi:hypothetical protein V7S43_002345 [Phytophthora oleae]|uniref:Alcohol dehydrogenase-like C-terminal domain-containing protein n=1 Tax=Phytophthora oleae TaxID=2107226 RepID=A0ABD3G1N8_9STRA